MCICVYIRICVYVSVYVHVYVLFLSDEGPTLETLDYTIRIGSTPTSLYFNMHIKYISYIHIRNANDLA